VIVLTAITYMGFFCIGRYQGHSLGRGLTHLDQCFATGNADNGSIFE